MFDYGQLGPLDVQLAIKDEIGVRISGATSRLALQQIGVEAGQSFEHFFAMLVGWKFSTKVCMEASERLVVGLFAEIYRQIDPLRLAEDMRNLTVARHYGEILTAKGQNLKPDALERLVSYYPSHNCLIDRDEAKAMFNKIEEPSAEVCSFVEYYKQLTRNASERGFAVNLSRLAANDTIGAQGASNGTQPNTPGATRGGTKAKGQGARAGAKASGSNEVTVETGDGPAA